ncbi:ESX secretion-associated protein EspG [Parasphingorhabdus pacifica]
MDFLLSEREFEVLWSDLGSGAAPFPLEVSSHGGTGAERDRMRTEVYDALRIRKLVEDDELDPDLDDLLGTLSRPEVVIDVVGYAEGTLRAVACGNGQAGVLARVVDGGIGLTGIRPTALPRSIVETVPDREMGRGPSMSLRHDDLLSATGQDGADDGALGADSEHDSLVRAGVDPENAVWLLRAAENRRSGGQFGVSLRESRSTMYRVPTMVTWFDTDSGRYLMVRDGDWVSIAPADRARIKQRLDAVIAEDDLD